MTTDSFCVDVPESTKTTMSEKRKADSEPEHTSPPSKQKIEAEMKSNFCNRIRSASNWISNMDQASFKDVTKEGKSKRQLFVLTDSTGKEQFCMVARVMDCRLSAEALSQPSQFEKSDKHTDLELHLTLRNDNQPGETWPTFDEDIDTASSALSGLREKAIRQAMMPIFASGKPMTGMNASQMKRFQKHSKSDEKLYEAIEEAWGGTGMNGNRDIARFKRRCYNQSDLSQAREFMDNWLNVKDENGDELDYINDASAISRGDLVLVWFRALAQCTAGNFHVSLEPRSIMRLSSGSSDTGTEGSIGFAAAMAKAMARENV